MGKAFEEEFVLDEGYEKATQVTVGKTSSFCIFFYLCILLSCFFLISEGFAPAAGPLLIGRWGSVNCYSFGALEGQLGRLWAPKMEVLGPTWEVFGPSWRSWG